MRIRLSLRSLNDNKRRLALYAAGIVVALLKTSDIAAQSDCTYTKSIWCGGSAHCTTESGNTCVTCPR